MIAPVYSWGSKDTAPRHSKLSLGVAVVCLLGLLVGIGFGWQGLQARRELAHLQEQHRQVLDGMKTLQGRYDQIRNDYQSRFSNLQDREQEFSQSSQLAQRAREWETRRAHQNARGMALQKALAVALGEVPQAKSAQVLLEPNECIVVLSSDLFFPSGENTVRNAGQEILDVLVSVLKAEDYQAELTVGVHTDALPIRSESRSRFPSNWELSAMRAATVARYLQEKAGLEPRRIRAVGHGSSRPLVAETTPEQRTQNRRVEIALVLGAE